MNSRIIEEACKCLGISEIPGSEHEQIILGWFHELGYNWIKDDETSWCSLFVNIVAKRAGVEYTKKLNARSWLEIGENIEKPLLGDVVIIWREKPNSWKGHVGFFQNHYSGFIHILGCNQKNKVCVTPYADYRLLGYRRLKPI